MSRGIVVFLLAAFILMTLAVASAFAVPPEAVNGCKGIDNSGVEEAPTATPDSRNPLIKLCKDVGK